MTGQARTTAELVADMREAAQCYVMWNAADIGHASAMLAVAADRLELLERENAELRRELDWTNRETK